MDKHILTPVTPEILVNRIAEKTVKVLAERYNLEELFKPSLNLKDSLGDLIPKSEVRGKLASSSTLWKWERDGKIVSYGIGGKRFYKRSELLEAITKLKNGKSKKDKLLSNNKTRLQYEK